MNLLIDRLRSNETRHVFGNSVQHTCLFLWHVSQTKEVCDNQHCFLLINKLKRLRICMLTCLFLWHVSQTTEVSSPCHKIGIRYIFNMACHPNTF